MTNAPDVSIEIPDLETGQRLSVTPKPGFHSAEGIVGWVYDDGVDLLVDGPAGPQTLRVKWSYVQSYAITEATDTIVRVYRGHQQADANARFRVEAEVLAEGGYFPSTQSWAAGQYGGGAFLLALLLMIVLIGFLVFIYMLIVKPDGTLTVTYTQRAPDSDEVAIHPSVAAKGSLGDRLRALEDAKTSGLISDEEYSSSRSRILEDA